MHHATGRPRAARLVFAGIATARGLTRRPRPGGTEMPFPNESIPQTAAPASAADAARRRSAELEAAIARDPAAFRVLTGDRPTGPLHVGHLFGTLENRVRLQEAGVELFVLVADYQVLTDRASAPRLPGDVEGQVADYLAAGIDPARATIFAHTQVAALNQLLLPFL